MIWRDIKAMLKIDEYNHVNKSLIKEWETLWEESPYKTFFNSYQWFDICLKTFGYNQLLIITIKEDKELKGILPLVKKKNYFISPGEKYLDNTTLLIKDKTVIKPLIDFMKNHHYHVILNEVESSITDEITELAEFASNNPRANLNNKIDKIVKHKELRYLKRVREKNCEHISFCIYQGQDCINQINRIFEIEKNSSKPNLKKAIFDNPKAQDLFVNISKTETAFLMILKYDNMDIAHLFCLKYGEIIMAYHMAYNLEFSKLQPGKLIFIELMNYMDENNYKILDFSRGNSTLKRHFSNENVVKFNVYVNCNLLMRITVLFRIMKNKIKSTRIYKKIKRIIKGM